MYILNCKIDKHADIFQLSTELHEDGWHLFIHRPKAIFSTNSFIFNFKLTAVLL